MSVIHFQARRNKNKSMVDFPLLVTPQNAKHGSDETSFFESGFQNNKAELHGLLIKHGACYSVFLLSSL